MKMKTKHGIRVWKESEGWGYTIQYKRTSDFGGTDVVYHMIDSDSGQLSLVSGSRLREMKRINKS